jgi:hypothetical protein
MEELITQYLFKNKQCPLPSLGVLNIIDGNALAVYRERKISAPVPCIKLLDAALPPDDFIEFISWKKNVSTAGATELLEQYCNRLKNLDAYSEKKLPGAGKFFVNAEGNLVFKSIEIPSAFHAEISAERVIHPASSHTMVVGDKETTNTEMAAYYSDIEAKSNDRWWIPAACLAAIAVVALFFYFNDQQLDLSFGNIQKTESEPVVKTYHVVE